MYYISPFSVYFIKIYILNWQFNKYFHTFSFNYNTEFKIWNKKMINWTIHFCVFHCFSQIWWMKEISYGKVFLNYNYKRVKKHKNCEEFVVIGNNTLHQNQTNVYCTYSMISCSQAMHDSMLNCTVFIICGQMTL